MFFGLQSKAESVEKRLYGCIVDENRRDLKLIWEPEESWVIALRQRTSAVGWEEMDLGRSARFQELELHAIASHWQQVLPF